MKERGYLFILQYLLYLSGPFPRSKADILCRFDMQERDLYRCNLKLKDAGFIVDLFEEGYLLRKSNQEGKTLSDLFHFSEEENFLLAKVIDKLHDENPLKESLRSKLYSVYDYKYLPKPTILTNKEGIIADIIDSIRNKEQLVLMAYRSSNSGFIRDRLVEAFELQSDFSSFWCYEPESRQCKLFMTRRVDQIKKLGIPWQFESEHQAPFTDAFRMSSLHKTNIRLSLSLRAANLMIEEYPLTQTFLKPVTDNEWQFDGWVCGFDGIGRFIMGLAEDVKIIKTNELSLFIKNRMIKALQQKFNIELTSSDISYD